MKARLPKDAYKEVRRAIDEGKRLDNGKLLATLTEYYNRKPGYRVCSQTPTMTGATTWFNICSIFF